MFPDPTRRFSSRVDNYVKYRPGYPPAVIAVLAESYGLTPSSVVADVASGTGIFTALLLQNGNPVYAVEPNDDMRAAAERQLAHYPNLTSLNGTAEATGLPDGCADFVTAAQAFHWFRRDEARSEFQRILKPGGWCAIVYNTRRTEATPLGRDYERLIQTYGTDYRHFREPQFNPELVRAFFQPHGCQEHRFPNQQMLDLDGLRGRLLSVSYAPEAGHPNHEPMLAELEQMFHTHQQGGFVTFEYTTTLYVGQL
ncbi:MAG: class I SAM-dependent methyltransferase [Chloroflexaceae bacterium]|jgi:SAM-dependent methyltransferase|nr:class I SAM-dependent methyltransferase [Chloroflexaceae bacterium]